MHFCVNCNNMYYLKLKNTNENVLIYYCRQCGNEKEMDDTNISVLKTNVNNVKDTFMNVINEYTKYDPTLPRTNNIKCPNVDCKSNIEQDDNNNIIYIRYDDINIKYIYLCSICDTNWLTSIE